jgi:hypothetical protein
MNVSLSTKVINVVKSGQKTTFISGQKGVANHKWIRNKCAFIVKKD